MHPAKADLLAKPDPWAIVIGHGEEEPDLPELPPPTTPPPEQKPLTKANPP
jgi:hypothetical protein